MSALSTAGYRLVVVSNQSGVARGLFTHGEARAMGRRVAALLAPYGVTLSGYYYCPHHPAGSVPELRRACECRKPEPGLLLRSARALRLDLARSWLIGDTLADIGASRAAGVRGILVDIGSKALEPGEFAPAVIARSLPHAAALILTADCFLSADVAPCSPLTLQRERPASRPRTPGIPSPFPADEQLEVARRDAEWLAALLKERLAAPGARDSWRSAHGGS